MTEQELQAQVADYLRLRYPTVLFHSDYGSGIKLTIGQAIRQKRLNGGRRSWPDMFIAETRCRYIKHGYDKPPKFGNYLCSPVPAIDVYVCCGLFIELKRPGTRILTKKGMLVANEHIREQFDMLELLRKSGYAAEFACGFDEAKKIIDEYLA